MAEVSTETEIKIINDLLVANEEKVNIAEEGIKYTTREITKVRNTLGIVDSGQSIPSVEASTDYIGRVMLDSEKLKTRKTGFMSKMLNIASLAGALAMGKMEGEGLASQNAENQAGNGIDRIEEIKVEQKKSESIPILTENGTWAPLMMSEILKEKEKVKDSESAMAFVRNSFSRFARELQNPPSNISAPNSKTVWGRIGTVDDWKSMSKGCFDLVEIIKDTAKKYNINEVNFNRELDYLSSYGKGLNDNADRMALDKNKKIESSPDKIKLEEKHKTILPYESGNMQDEAYRRGMLKEKRLIVHGFIELPDKRYGIVVPNSEETLADGQIIHTEVKRIYDYSDASAPIDDIVIRICNEAGKLIAGSVVKKGSPEYDKYFPIADKLTKDLDRDLYSDIFKDNPLESVLE